jgi:tetratricopeptide (TPR) repeat protein
MIRCRRREVEIARGLYGGEHPETLAARSGLGLALRRAGRLDEADGVLTDVLRVRRRVLGPDHERTLTSLDYLGLLREMQGRFDEALAIFEEYVSIRRSKTDDQSWLTINGMRHAARQLVWLARPGEAEAIAREAYGLMRGSHGEGTNYELFLVDVLVWACAESGRIDQAESFLGELDALIDDFTRSKQPTSTQIALGVQRNAVNLHVRCRGSSQRVNHERTASVGNRLHEDDEGGHRDQISRWISGSSRRWVPRLAAPRSSRAFGHALSR